MNPCPSTLSRLWALTGQPLPVGGEAYNVHFDSIGLLLAWPLIPSAYDWCAPTNVLRFAETGGDGVHCSLLLLDGVLSEDSPVVMTVPMAMEDSTNFIVGENLRDFLALGSRRGYFFLEQLAYKPEWLLNELADADFGEEVAEEARASLTAVGNAFDLHPWGGRVADRLEWLKREFFPLLALPPAQ